MSGSGLTFKLHPLVILNVSDHHTREKMKADNENPPRVLGCLLGVQTGRTVEIFNSFALHYGTVGEDMETDQEEGNNSGREAEIDREYMEKKIAQYNKVFPTYDVLGWYATGSQIENSDMNIHRSLMTINENPIFLLLNPTISPGKRDLPLTIYESELHVIDGLPSPIFVESSYSIETVEAERISVDHVAHIKPSDGSSAATQLAAHLTSMHSAIKMLSGRVQVLLNLLDSMKRGLVPMDHSLLRQVASLARQLPAIDSQKFNEEFTMEYNDTLLIAYLATLTKGTQHTHDLVDKLTVGYEKGRGVLSRGPFG